MDGLIKLFCGCCGLNQEQETPYRPLVHSAEDVMTIRDPPISNPNLYQTAHLNGGFDAMDGPTTVVHQEIERTPSPVPVPVVEEREKTEKEKEKDLLDDILETTQHNIIAVGHLDHNNVESGEITARERHYETLIYENDKQNHKTSTSKEHAVDFEFIAHQRPVELPLFYEEVSPTIPSNPLERAPFACPNKSNIHRVRPIGLQDSNILVEHSEVKKAGRLPAIPQAMRQKLRECAQEIHNGVEACQIEHKTELVVHMDF